MRGHRRLSVELTVVGLLILVVAAGLTTVNCDPDLNRRAADEAFNMLVCPDTPAGSMGPEPPYYILFSRVFLLWLLGAGTLLAGLALGLRHWLRGRRSTHESGDRP